MANSFAMPLLFIGILWLDAEVAHFAALKVADCEFHGFWTGFDIDGINVAVDQHRKAVAFAAGGDEDMFVEVSAEHYVDVGIVEDGQEHFLGMERAMPCAPRWRNVNNSYFVRRIFELRRSHDVFEPLSLGQTVIVHAVEAEILNVGIGLVLATVEHNEKYRTMAECKIWLVGFGGKIVEIVFGEDSAALMISTHHIEWGFRGK